MERNQWMIDDSDCSIFYYNREKSKAKSGATISFAYAQKKEKWKEFAIIDLKGDCFDSASCSKCSKKNK